MSTIPFPRKNSSAASSRNSAAPPDAARPPLAKTRTIPPSKLSSRPPAHKWVAVQLSSVGEREKTLPLIVRSVQQILRTKLNVFIPAISQKVREESETLFFMDGYIFVQFDPSINYLKLQETTYFSTVLRRMTTIQGKKQYEYSLLSDRELDPMRRGMQNLKIAEYQMGQPIKIVKGTYRNLLGTVAVVYENGEMVQIAVQLRSKPLLLDFPVTYIKKME